MDPLLQAWQIAWDGHALLHQPLDWFQANTFFPLPNSLAFSDALIGYTPAGLIGSGTAAALARYNVLFIFSYVLAFAGAYWLARELGLGRGGALVAGVAFAYAPWRISQWPHLNVLSSGGIPLALAALVRGYRLSAAGMVLAGWLIAAWQISLGFTLGVQLVYLLPVVGLVVLLTLHRSGRLRRPPRRVVVATAAGVCVVLAVTAVIALPYLAVLRDHPEAHRVLSDVRFYSPPPAGLLSAPEHDLVWGGTTRSVRDTLDAPFEQSLWPGLVIALLALVGAFRGPLSIRLRRWLGAGVAVTIVLAFGVRLFGDLSPYRLLYEFAPGWDGVRTPGRIFTLTTLCLALLAGAGASALAQRLRVPRAQMVVPVLFASAIVFEGYGSLAHPSPPQPPAGVVLSAPRLYLPSADSVDSLYMFWSVDGFPEIINGQSGVRPRLLDATRAFVRAFPDRESVDLLRQLGVRSVVLTHLSRRTQFEAIMRRPTAGLGITRRQAGDSVVFTLAPAR